LVFSIQFRVEEKTNFIQFPLIESLGFF